MTHGTVTILWSCEAADRVVWGRREGTVSCLLFILTPKMSWFVESEFH